LTRSTDDLTSNEPVRVALVAIGVGSRTLLACFCGPPSMHAAVIAGALDAGRHVFSTKPLTNDLSDGPASYVPPEIGHGAAPLYVLLARDLPVTSRGGEPDVSFATCRDGLRLGEIAAPIVERFRAG
jgi:hypothetical protein